MKTYDNVLAHIEKHAAAAMRTTQTRIVTQQERANEQMAIISRVTTQFLTTGIADLTNLDYLYDLNYHNTHFGRLGWKWARYIKDLAIEHKRPYVSVVRGHTYRYDNTEQRNSAYIALQITKRKYTEPLVAMFHICGEHVTVQHDTRWWDITLRGNVGEEVYNLWRKQCAEHTLFKKALRLIK
jgi:hypothetical protein